VNTGAIHVVLDFNKNWPKLDGQNVGIAFAVYPGVPVLLQRDLEPQPLARMTTRDLYEALYWAMSQWCRLAKPTDMLWIVGLLLR
jgi:hypothetical protein